MSEEVFQAVRELLPEIEKEIREELTSQLQEEYQRKLEEHIEKTREEAKRELESVFEEIQQQTFQSFQEKLQQLEEQERTLGDQREQIEREVRAEVESVLREQYEQEKTSLAQQVLEEFSQSGELEEKLRVKLQEEMEEKLRVELEKKEKLLKINFKKRLEQERKQIEEGFQVEWKQRVESERKQMEKERSEIARLRSLENVRLKKLEDEKKLFKQQMRDQEVKYQEIVHNLQNQIIRLEGELQDLQQRQQELMREREVTLQDQLESHMAIPLSQLRKPKDKQIQEIDYPLIFQKQDESKTIKNQDIKLESLKKSQTLGSNSQVTPKLDSAKYNQQTPKLDATKTSTQQKVQDPQINKILFGQEEPVKENKEVKDSILDKDAAKSFISKYQDELNKLMGKQNKENSTLNQNPEQVQQQPQQQSLKYTEVLKKKWKEKEEKEKKPPLVEKKPFSNQTTSKQQPQETPSSFEQLFSTNDMDNEKNQQMKKLRKEIILKLQKDNQVKTKYEGMQLYMTTDLVGQYQDDANTKEFLIFLEQLFDTYDIAQVSFQERLDYLKYLQFQMQPQSLGNLVPIIQNKVFQMKSFIQSQPPLTFESLKQRDQLKEQIAMKWQGYSKAKQQYQELKDLHQHLRTAKFKWHGIEIEELIKLDQWEQDYMQREELKSQLLHKIQTKIL